MTETAEEFLEHFGIKGMRWGVRNDSNPGVHPKTNRDAKEHAEEFARAKLFFGQGAGTRRKLIANRVEAKSKQDPAFKLAFDHHLARQDLSFHADRAVAERRRKDAINTTAKTGRGVKNFFLRNGAPITMGALAIGVVATNPQVQAFTKKHAKTAYSSVKHTVNAYKINKVLNGTGLI